MAERRNTTTTGYSKERYSSPFAMLNLEPENFHDELKSFEDRQAFKADFPQEFWEMWSFTRDSVDWGPPLFMRYEFLRFLDHYKPATAFDPPRVGRGPEEQQQAILESKARWWTRGPNRQALVLRSAGKTRTAGTRATR